MLQLLIALILVVACIAATVKEPSSGHSYNKKDRFNDLVGTGIRIKQIGPIKAKVYSTGLYASKGALIGKCKGIKCKSASELSKSKVFQSAFIKGGIEKKYCIKNGTYSRF
jgi:hypothetical protein